MTTFFCICLVALPWIINPYGRNSILQFRIPKEMFFDFICMGMVCFGLARGLNKYANKYLSWFAGWVFITIGINLYLPIMSGIGQRKLWTIIPSIHFILGLVATYIAIASFKKEDYIKISKAICLSAFLISFVGLLQILGFDIFGKLGRYTIDSPDRNKLCAFLDNPNFVGNYLALALPFLISQKQRFYKAWFILVVVVLALSRSELSMVCGVVGLIAYMLFTYRNRIVAGIVSLLTLVVAGNMLLNKEAMRIILSDRLPVWKIAIEKIKDNPIFGQGFGNLPASGLKLGTTPLLSAHNEYLEVWVACGAIGLVLGLLVISNAIRGFRGKEYAYLASFIAFLLVMFGSFPFGIAPLALVGLVTFWGVENGREDNLPCM